MHCFHNVLSKPPVSACHNRNKRWKALRDFIHILDMDLSNNKQGDFDLMQYRDFLKTFDFKHSI